MVGDLNNNNKYYCSSTGINTPSIATRNLKIDENHDIINISKCHETVIYKSLLSLPSTLIRCAVVPPFTGLLGEWKSLW